MFNDGSVSNVTEWLFENVQIPPTARGARLKLQSQFDLKSGAVGLDNIQLHTKQK
jgi:hypothetical protein